MSDGTDQIDYGKPRWSEQLLREARAFRYYGASAEAEELEGIAVQVRDLEDEIARLRHELEWLGRESLMSKGMEP